MNELPVGVAQFASALDRGVAASDAAAFGAALAEPIRTEPATDERRKRTVIEIDLRALLLSASVRLFSTIANKSII